MVAPAVVANGARMNLTRLTFLAAIGLLSSLAAAEAGDVAEIEILGFSHDGGIFAFEEYGVQDGSGFPYANRYYIDTKTDKFLKGTPVRARIDDEGATMVDARRKAREGSQIFIEDSELAQNRGHTAAFNAVTELSADPYRVVVNPRPVFPPIDAPVEFRLEQFPLTAQDRCEGLGEPAGFRLLRINASENGKTVLLHEDKALPQSRNCPTGYRIGGVQTFFDGKNGPVFAVLIAVQGVGFEGPDYRWIAVTGKL
jgi:predicted secreted protein